MRGGGAGGNGEKDWKEKEDWKGERLEGARREGRLQGTEERRDGKNGPGKSDRSRQGSGKPALHCILRDPGEVTAQGGQRHGFL